MSQYDFADETLHCLRCIERKSWIILLSQNFQCKWFCNIQHN